MSPLLEVLVECEASQHPKVLKTNTTEIKNSEIKALRLITSIKGISTPSCMVIGCVLIHTRYEIELDWQGKDSNNKMHARSLFPSLALSSYLEPNVMWHLSVF